MLLKLDVRIQKTISEALRYLFPINLFRLVLKNFELSRYSSPSQIFIGKKF